MIEHQKEKYHWEFLFLGADIDAVSVADRLGIRANRAVRYEHDSAGTQLNFEVLEKAVRFARCATSAAQMSEALDDEAILEPIRQDYKKKHRK